MFDEMFPGMGMMGMYGMNPMMMGMNPGMFSGMQQYRQPGADIFSNMGIMNPQQQMFQQVEMRNMLEQQQFAREQQMLAMRNMSMNMGANAAQVGSGFAGPMLMAMGGLQNGQMDNGVQGLANALIGKYQQGNQGQPGMVPMGQQAAASQASQIDPSQIIANFRTKYPNDPGRAYTEAGQNLVQLGKASGNDALIQAGVRTMDQGNKISLANAQTQSSTTKNTSDAAEARARANSITASLTKPDALGQFHDAQGRVGAGYTQYNPATGEWDIKSAGMGVPMQYVLPQTPGDISKAIGDFRDRLSNTEDAITRIRQVKQGLVNGAAQGWTADGVTLVNDLQGAIEQLAPGSMIDSDGQKLLGSYKGDFNSWAQSTGVNESTWADLTMALAKSYAKGGRISNQDISRAKESIGENYSDPRTVTAILNNVEQRTIGDVNRDYAYLHSSATMPQQRQDIENLNSTFNARIASPASGGKVLNYDPSTGTFK